jgi:Na+-driven multidrug efflux pump
MAFFYPIKVPMLTLFGASENSLGYAIEYFDIIVAFFPFYMLSNMMNGIIRADGSPSLAMAAILVGAIVNIALDPVFIYALDMGMSGAAWATVIGQMASFAVSAVAMKKTKSFKLTLKSFLPDLKVFWGALSLGISTFITQITILVISVSCNIMLAKYGMASSYGVDIPIAIIGIQSKVFTVVINLVVGIVLGCQPIISYNMGAMKYGRVKKLYKNMTLCTLVIGLASTVLFVFFPRAIVGLFGEPTNIPNPDAYWEFGEKTFRIFLSCVTFTCFVKVSSIFFQSAGKPIYAVISSTVRDIVCFLPLIILLPMSMGIDGILFAAPIADVISMAIAVIITVAFWRTLGRAEREN